MCVRCHPEQPALVAAGTFNGEVMVWDLSRGLTVKAFQLPGGEGAVEGKAVEEVGGGDAFADEQLVASSRIDDYFHREPISSVRHVVCVRRAVC